MKRCIPKDDYETLSEFRHSLRRFLRFSEDEARRVGLTPQQHQALLAVKGFRGGDAVTVGELAERLQIRHHSAVGLVDRLVSNGLAKRKLAREDHRQVMVSLTVRGNRKIEELARVHRRELLRIGPDLTRTLKRLAVA